MDQWAVLPEDPLGWMHSGAAVVNGHIVVAHPGKPALLSYTPDGDLEGRFLRTAGNGIVVTPTDMTIVGETLALTNFTRARVTNLDKNDQLIEHIGANAEAPKQTTDASPEEGILLSHRRDSRPPSSRSPTRRHSARYEQPRSPRPARALARAKE